MKLEAKLSGLEIVTENVYLALTHRGIALFLINNTRFVLETFVGYRNPSIRFILF